MKNSLWNSDLWQKKRDELKVDADPGADWNAMRSALDEQMPVLDNSGTGRIAASSQSGTIIIMGIIGLVSLICLLFYLNYKPDKKEKPLANHPTDRKLIVANKLSAQRSSGYSTTTYTDSITHLETQITSANAVLAKLNSIDNASKSVRDSIVMLQNQIAAINNTLTRTTLDHLKKVAEEKKEEIPDLVLIPSKERSGASGKSKTHNVHSSNGKTSGLYTKNNRGVPVADADKEKLNSNPGSRKSGNHHPQNAIENSDADRSLTAINGYHPQTSSPWFSQANPPVSFDLKKRYRGDAANEKAKEPKNNSPAKPLPFDYGILIGANTGGSFTSQSLNKNIYGSLPVDGYAGLFADFHIKDKWGMNVQVRALSPLNISGGYSHANQSKVDSGKLIQVNDSRKVYFVSVPIHATYQIADNLKLKGGPVVNVLIKQINGVAALSPSTIQKDSVYYKKTVAQLAGTTYDQTINIGLSAGLNYQYKRLNLEMNYMQSVTGYKVTSDFGSYKANPGTVQFTVGFQLNRLKNK